MFFLKNQIKNKTRFKNKIAGYKSPAKAIHVFLSGSDKKAKQLMINKKLKTIILGVSKDSKSSHCKFIEKYYSIH